MTEFSVGYIVVPEDQIIQFTSVLPTDIVINPSDTPSTFGHATEDGLIHTDGQLIELFGPTKSFQKAQHTLPEHGFEGLSF